MTLPGTNTSPRLGENPPELPERHDRSSIALIGFGARLAATCRGNCDDMSEARTPEEETIETELSRVPDEDVPVDDEYDGPDPEDDPKGDDSDEDQGT